MIGMVWLLFVLDEHVVLDNAMATVTDVLPTACCLLLQVTWMAQGSPTILDKSSIRQLTVTQLTQEALWMPVVIHSFDYTPNHKLIAFPTAGRKQDMEVMFTILPPFKLEEYTIWKGSEALSTDKALLMPDFTMRIHNPLVLFEACVAADAH